MASPNPLPFELAQIGPRLDVLSIQLEMPLNPRDPAANFLDRQSKRLHLERQHQDL